jgi:GNAT superfamily N-acetyltransferase
MDLIVREAGMEDLPNIKKLVNTVFDENVAHLYSAEGIRTFKGHIELEKMRERMRRNYWALIAENRDLELFGTIFLKNRDHINLFFVRTDSERKGIGRALLDKAVKTIKEEDPSVNKITVNSSPNAVDAYSRLGFTVTGEEKVLHGIRFVPMELLICEQVLP